MPQSSFSSFPLLPGELQNLIWSHATSPQPQIHFLTPIPPRCPGWKDCDLLLPTHQSGALSLVHLSLSCRDARAAVLRRNKTLCASGKATLLRVAWFESQRTAEVWLDLGLVGTWL